MDELLYLAKKKGKKIFLIAQTQILKSFSARSSRWKLLMPTILDKSHKSLKVQNWIKKSWIPHHHWYLPHSTVSSSQHVQGRVSNIHWAYLFWPSPHHLGNTVYTKHMEVTSQLITRCTVERTWITNLISIQLYLKHFSQIWFFIKIISAYEDKWQLVCHGFTDCAISNLSWSSKKKKKHRYQK